MHWALSLCLLFSNAFLADAASGANVSEVCYDGLECFRNGGDFSNKTIRPSGNVLPNSPKTINTNFILHTRSHKAEPIKYEDAEGILGSNFDAMKQTKFIIHGYSSSGHETWVKSMVKELLVHDDYNVIAVDWEAGAKGSYLQATANTRVVGAIVAQFIVYLKEKFNLDFGKVHIIAHSLGAHIAGYAGERIDKISRISGLDVAAPFFDGMPRSVRLDDTDAQFVDVIHTDDGSILGPGFGTTQISGHVDFFPNDGANQPGCPGTSESFKYSERLQGIGGKILRFVACDHKRAIALFTNSINPDCPFNGFQCSSWENFKKGKCGNCGPNGAGCAQMGFYADSYAEIQTTVAESRFYLRTSSAAPFCVFNYQIIVQLYDDTNSGKQQGYFYLTITGELGKTKKVKLNSKLLKVEHPGTYSFLLTDAVNVGKIANIDFGWKYKTTFSDPRTWKITKKIKGLSIELYVEHIKVNQMYITEPGLKKHFPTIFCSDKEKPVTENGEVRMYPESYCQ